MSTGTAIQWTDATWNPVVGCTPVSPGCLNCYAATFAARGMHENYVGLTVRRKGEGGRTRAVFNGTVRCLPEKLDQPLRWRKPRRVFVNSMSDLFHEAVPFEFIDKCFAVMALCPQHTFQVLTKRPARMAEYLCGLRDPERLRTVMNKAADGGEHRAGAYNLTSIAQGAIYGRTQFLPPFRNVWLGTSVENQKTADQRIPHLLRCPAAVRFLSCEPLLGALSLNERQGAWLGPASQSRGMHDGIDWVIVGGESGPGARPCDVEWVRSIVGQCKDAGVPVFVKQLGGHVVCRNDHVSDWLDEQRGEISLDDIITEGVTMQGDPVRVHLRDRKGGDPSEWPTDLRVREFPEARA